MRAARTWSTYEGRCAYLRPNETAVAELGLDALSLCIARLEAHYFLHAGFLEDGQLLQGMAAIRHLPAVIVQGRYDMVCPPVTAYRLHHAWPGSQLVLVDDAGHSAGEPGNRAALVAATESWKMRGAF